MATLAKWLAEFEFDHGKVEEVYIHADSSWGDYGLDGWPHTPTGPCSPSDAVATLAIEFDDGYGAPGCPAVSAWSAEWVFFVSCYDGSTSWDAVSRSPRAHATMPGGG